MTSLAEFLEQLNRKKNELEESRGIVSDSLLKVLESEIAEMEEAIASGDVKRVEALAFVDECQG